LVKEFTPWIGEAETITKTALAKPQTLDDCLALLETSQQFDAVCVENKTKLESAAKARESMEKPSNTENMVEGLTGRWDGVKKVAAERVEKVTCILQMK